MRMHPTVFKIAAEHYSHAQRCSVLAARQQLRPFVEMLEAIEEARAIVEAKDDEDALEAYENERR